MSLDLGEFADAVVLESGVAVLELEQNLKVILIQRHVLYILLAIVGLLLTLFKAVSFVTRYVTPIFINQSSGGAFFSLTTLSAYTNLSTFIGWLWMRAASAATQGVSDFIAVILRGLTTLIINYKTQKYFVLCLKVSFVHFGRFVSFTARF